MPIHNGRMAAISRNATAGVPYRNCAGKYKHGKTMSDPGRKNSWLWFFGILALLTVISIAGLWIYNWNQQLKPEQLAAARELWEQKKPASYDLEYTKRQGGTTERYVVQVRKGKVVDVTLNGQRVTREDKPGQPDFFVNFDMRALFVWISDFQKLDAEPDKPRAFAVAVFDRQDGHLIRYIHRVMGTRDQVEIAEVLLRPVGNDGPNQ